MVRSEGVGGSNVGRGVGGWCGRDCDGDGRWRR